MDRKPHIMVVEAPFYRDISDELAKGAIAVLDARGATYERYEVPGALEIPAAVLYGVRMKERQMNRRAFDGYIALGCVIKGETYHFEIVANESARGLQQVALDHDLALGNGVLTTYTKAQAMERARVSGENKGGAAATTCLEMLALKNRLGLI
jgi:6,7-dimethyl-8-ribityllumazine synthase